jgi:hypothetical protein
MRMRVSHFSASVCIAAEIGAAAQKSSKFPVGYHFAHGEFRHYAQLSSFNPVAFGELNRLATFYTTLIRDSALATIQIANWGKM